MVASSAKRIFLREGVVQGWPRSGLCDANVKAKKKTYASRSPAVHPHQPPLPLQRAVPLVALRKLLGEVLCQARTELRQAFRRPITTITLLGVLHQRFLDRLGNLEVRASGCQRNAALRQARPAIVKSCAEECVVLLCCVVLCCGVRFLSFLFSSSLVLPGLARTFRSQHFPIDEMVLEGIEILLSGGLLDMSLFRGLLTEPNDAFTTACFVE